MTREPTSSWACLTAGLVALCLSLGSGCSSSDGVKTDGGAIDSQAPAGDGSTATGDGAVQPTCKQVEFPFAFDGMCYAKPAADGKRTQCGEIVENCDTTGQTKPQLGCWTADPLAPPQGPATVTLAGFVDVFSSGPDADNLIIEVYDYDELHAAVLAASKEGKLKAKFFPSVSPIATDTVSLVWDDKSTPPMDPTRGPARACPADKQSGLPCVVPTAGCGSTQPYCDLGADQYCHEDHCEDRLRWEIRYRAENVPTNRRLVVRSRGTGEFNDGTWGVMLLYSVYLRADAPSCEPGQVEHCINDRGEYELEVNAISRADYSTIPITAGLAGGIPAGKGVVSGEVRDCDGIKLEGFQVNTTPTPTVMVYFNGNPIRTLPDLARFDSGTNADGLYAALDIAPGVVEVGAVGRVDGKDVTAGKFTAAVLPDSVTVVALDGPDPQ